MFSTNFSAVELFLTGENLVHQRVCFREQNALKLTCMHLSFNKFWGDISPDLLNKRKRKRKEWEWYLGREDSRGWEKKEREIAKEEDFGGGYLLSP